MTKKHKQPRLFLPNNPLAPQLCPELAQEIGLNESILLLQWEFWMRTDGIERDGYLWLQRSVREIKQTFVFWGIGTIHRTIKSLESKGYLVSAESDDQTGQSAPLFRFDFDRLTQLKTIRVVFQDGTGGVPDCSKSVPTRNTVLIDKEKKIIKKSHRDPVLPHPEPETLPPYFGAEFTRALDDFEQHRIELKKPLRPTGRKALYDKLGVWEERKATVALVDATANGWTGVFEPKSQNSPNGNGHKTSDDRPIWMASKK